MKLDEAGLTGSLLKPSASMKNSLLLRSNHSKQLLVVEARKEFPQPAFIYIKNVHFDFILTL